MSESDSPSDIDTEDSPSFSDSDDQLSSDNEFVDVDGLAEGPAVVVRGVQPYRFEPAAVDPGPVPDDEAAGAEANVGGHHGNDQLLNSDW